MASIKIDLKSETNEKYIFTVEIEQEGSSTNHIVDVDKSYYEKLTGGKISAEDLMIKSFQFLLQHEPKEAILSRFELSVISRYFPEYESVIKTM